MNWKMIFIIYAKGKGEEKIELARNKITGVDDLEFFIPLCKTGSVTFYEICI
jgi:hypothetical protein